MRRRITAGNWKMYKTASETARFIEKYKQLNGQGTSCEVVIFPTALSIPVAVAVAEGSDLQVGGQTIYWAPEGAFTGEISAEMMSDAGARWVLVGHSERRHQVCHETDAEVLKKAQAAIRAGLKPIICMGEKLEEHKAGKAHDVLIRQFAGGVAGLTEEQFAQVVLAYEPVWAIGTGQTATPQIASEAHKLIRSETQKRFGDAAAQQVRILYGGSVKPDNIEGLMAEPEIDGTLVGGASLDPDSFYKIARAA
jgi:triosephosphate isomerase